MRRIIDWLDRHLNPAAAYMHSQNVELCVLDLHHRIVLLERQVEELSNQILPKASGGTK